MASSATKRVSRSAIDWGKFAAVCPKFQLDMMRASKAKHDTFLNKVHAMPESLPKIDFASYKTRMANPAMADRFEKAYAGLNIPYPTDKDNVMGKVEAEGKKKADEVKKFVAEVQSEIEESKTFLKKMDSLPKIENLTLEMMIYYFPESWMCEQRPTIWPHIEEEQPYNPDFKYIK